MPVTREIYSNDLIVSINDVGAELQSIFCTRGNAEYLWQAKPPYWQSCAPILFPIVGQLKNGSFNYNGKNYAMDKHGFARKSAFACIREESSRLVFSLADTPETMAIFPFRFNLQVTYSLHGPLLEVEYLVRNPGARELLFGIGAHEGFCCPRQNDEGFDDYYLEFSGDTDELLSTAITNDGFLTDDSFLLTLENNCLPLDYQLFKKHDTLLFRDIKHKQVSIKSNKQQSYVEVVYDAPNLAIWTQPGAHFLCIEPWHGLPDHSESNGDFSSKESNVCLQSGESKSFHHKILIVH
jgi:galactose mutarotase-like enzyme